MADPSRLATVGPLRLRSRSALVTADFVRTVLGMSRRGTLVALAGIATGIAIAWLMLANDVRDLGGGDVALVLAVGWAFIASGVIAWDLRPENPIGTVMVVTGFLRFVTALGWSQDPVIFSIGRSLQPAYLVGLVYVLLAFPGGHLISRVERWLFAVTVVAAGPFHVAWLMFGGGIEDASCAACPAYVFELLDSESLARAFQLTHEWLGVLAAILALGVLVHRWRHASAPFRFAIAPILWAGVAAVLAGLFWMITGIAGNPLGRAPAMVMELMLALVAVAFLVGVARTRLARAAVADLIIGLGDSPAPGKLETALGQALHDPSLSIAYWLPDEERFVDPRGKSIDLSVDDGRTVTMIEKDGRRIAALVHDPATLEDEQLVQSVSAAAALQLENERLQAEILAQLEEVEASRARIVEAAQQERRRIERALHDGTQQRLVSIAMMLGLADSKLAPDPARAARLLADARSQMSEALQELRDLSQGIHPGILTERGLPAALSELTQRIEHSVALEVHLTERLPDRVEEAAYFVVCEALTNVMKHAHATRAFVQIECRDDIAVLRVADDGVGGAAVNRGSGLRGLQDRVEALGGQLSVESPPAAGTTLEALIPCAW